MTAEVEKFIVATFALWAGDFLHFSKLLKEFSPPHRTERITNAIETPEDLIRAAGALRLRQFRQKRGEFRKLAAEHQRRDVSLGDVPLVLATNHLRAAIWRVEEREFNLYGYLTDPTWGNFLFKNARRAYAATRTRQSKGSTPVQADLYESDLEEGAKTSNGTHWVTAGPLFIRAQLTDLGLIEATGLWVEPQLPSDATMITAPFQNLLELLDPPMTAGAQPQAEAIAKPASFAIDTIVVPAREEGFRRTFLAERRWHPVRIHPSMLPRIKYIAVYRSAPISAITHIASVRDIARWKGTPKYVLNFAERPREITPIKLVPKPIGSVRAPHGPRYTSYARLMKATNLDEAF
jgi:hypothetical protein